MKPMHVSCGLLLIIIVGCNAFYSVTRDGEQCQFFWSTNTTSVTRRQTTHPTTRPFSTTVPWSLFPFGNPFSWVGHKLKMGVAGYLHSTFSKIYQSVCSYLPGKINLFRFYMLYYPVKLRAVNGTLAGLDMGCKYLQFKTVRSKPHTTTVHARLDMSHLRIKYDIESNINLLGSKIDWSLEKGSFLELTVTVDQDARCLILVDDIDLKLVINDHSEYNTCKGYYCKKAQNKLMCFVHKMIRQFVEITTWRGINSFLKNVICLSFKS